MNSSPCLGKTPFLPITALSVLWVGKCCMWNRDTGGARSSRPAEPCTTSSHNTCPSCRRFMQEFGTISCIPTDTVNSKVSFALRSLIVHVPGILPQRPDVLSLLPIVTLLEDTMQEQPNEHYYPMCPELLIHPLAQGFTFAMQCKKWRKCFSMSTCHKYGTVLTCTEYSCSLLKSQGTPCCKGEAT